MSNQRIIFQAEIEELRIAIFKTDNKSKLLSIKKKLLDLHPLYIDQKKQVDDNKGSYLNNPSIVMYDDCLQLLESKIDSSSINFKSNIALFISILSLIGSVIIGILSIIYK